MGNVVFSAGVIPVVVGALGVLPLTLNSRPSGSLLQKAW